MLVRPNSLPTAGRRFAFASTRRIARSAALRAAASHPRCRVCGSRCGSRVSAASRLGRYGVCAVSDRMLTAGDVEAIADAIAQKVLVVVSARSTSFARLDARELAHELRVSVDYVYAHSTALGAMRLGSGPKRRIRFDLDRARQAVEAPARPRGRRRPPVVSDAPLDHGWRFPGPPRSRRRSINPCSGSSMRTGSVRNSACGSITCTPTQRSCRDATLAPRPKARIRFVSIQRAKRLKSAGNERTGNGGCERGNDELRLAHPA